MTHEEKKQIGKMRAAGMSYTRIAESLDISINSVKSYCRRNGLGADTACAGRALPAAERGRRM